MKKSSHYKTNRVLHIYMPWTLVLVSFYSVPLNLYRGEMWWMSLGLVGTMYLMRRAIEAGAIDFAESEQTWLHLDEEIEKYGLEKPRIRDALKEMTLREFIKSFRSKNK